VFWVGDTAVVALYRPVVSNLLMAIEIYQFAAHFQNFGNKCPSPQKSIICVRNLSHFQCEHRSWRLSPVGLYFLHF